MQRLRSLFRVLARRRDFENGMSEELRFHIEQYTDDLVRSGISREKAGRMILTELGNPINMGLPGSQWVDLPRPAEARRQ